MRVLHPPGWPETIRLRQRYRRRSGETVFVGGQIGWNAQGQFADGLAAQIGQALQNIVGGSSPKLVARRPTSCG